MDTAQRQVWLDQARDGDPDALGRLIESYRPYLAVVTRGFMNELVQPKLGHSDLIQDAQMIACRDFEQFQGFTANEFCAWFRELAIHAAQRMVEKVFAEKRDPKRELYASSLLRRIAQPGTSPSSMISHQEQSLQMAEAMSELSEEYQQILWARHHEQLSYKELAEQFGEPAATMRSRYFRAVRRLRKMLAQ